MSPIVSQASSDVGSLKPGDLQRISVCSAAGQPCPLTVHQPELWWPAGFGKQPIYSLSVSLSSSPSDSDGLHQLPTVLDSVERTTLSVVPSLFPLHFDRVIDHTHFALHCLQLRRIARTVVPCRNVWHPGVAAGTLGFRV